MLLPSQGCSAVTGCLEASGAAHKGGLPMSRSIAVLLAVVDLLQTKSHS